MTNTKTPSPLLVIIAFATVYIVWGSTYFFIQMAVHGFPPFLLGAVRFFTAGMLMLLWCIAKGEKIFIKKSIITSGIVGVLLLVIGNGIVIWVEQKLPSAMVAIMLSTAPLWFVILDKQNWRINLNHKATVVGLIIGFVGIVLLFGEQVSAMLASTTNNSRLPGMLLLIIAPIAWSSGSLYSKYHPSEGSAVVNVAWQMIIAGIVFVPGSLLNQEFNHLQIQNIPTHSWMALSYLIVFGSIVGYSAYVWLLQVCPATKVSTYAYVNPVIAVILGILFAAEHVSVLQIVGLAIILGSVLLINLSKYRKEKVIQNIETDVEL